MLRQQGDAAHPLPTRLPDLDRALHGGFPCGSVTEIVGPAGEQVPCISLLVGCTRKRVVSPLPLDADIKCIGKVECNPRSSSCRTGKNAGVERNRETRKCKLCLAWGGNLSEVGGGLAQSLCPIDRLRGFLLGSNNF